MSSTKIFATDYIFIGDSRTVGLESMYKTYLSSSSPLKKNKNITWLNLTGSGYQYWFQQKGNALMTKAIEKANKKANNTKVIFWLGVNDCATSGIAKKYATAINALAKKYSKVKFYYFSVTGVEESRYKSIKNFNEKIVKFDRELRSELNTNRSNLSFVKIYSKVQKYVNTKNTDSLGLHYSDNLYKQIFTIMMDKIS